MKTKNILFIVLMGIICLIFSSCNSPKEEVVVIEQPEEKQNKSQTAKHSEEEEAWIWVDISGAVNTPGVYRMKQGSRVFEAVQEAGGFLENADTAGINQASILSDGEKLQIYTIEEAEQMEMQPKEFSGSSENTDVDGKININTADLAKLQEIPGVGEKKAQSIMEYRETCGGFQSIEQLQEVPGIKGKTFDKVKDYITVK